MDEAPKPVAAVPAPKPPKARGAQPRDASVRLPKEEWAAIHGDDPLSIYELRPRAWRPSQSVIAKDQPPCSNCGTTVQEMIAADASRCMGCGAVPAKG